MSIEKNIFEAVDSIVSQRIDSTPIDSTITATITRIQNVAIGEYKVTYQSNTFSAYSLDPLTVYRQGQEVYVLVPRGDFSSQKVILGEAAFNDKVTYADRQAMQNQWRTRGPNWLSPEWYWKDTNGNFRGDKRDAGVVVCKKGMESGNPNTTNPSGANYHPNIGPNAAWRRYVFFRPDILPTPQEEEGKKDGEYTDKRWAATRFTGPTTYTTAGQTALRRADADLQLWGTHLDYIMVTANFETLLMNKHSSGEYGVLVECYVDNPRFGLDGYDKEPEYLITTFRLSFGDFNGARYSFSQPTPQQAVFQVPRNVIKGLVRVSLYQDNGWQTDITPDPNRTDISFVIPSADYVTKTDNIIASDISIHWCEPINLTDRLFWIKVDAIRGNSLFNTTGATSWIERIPLRARLMYGSKDVTSRENCKFLWFRQKYSALRSAAEGSEQDEFGNTWAAYLPEGENGWAPLTLMQKPIGDNPFAEHLTGEDNYELGSFPSDSAINVVPDTFHEGLTIPINKIPWKWKYMVVCYYNPSGDDLSTIQRSNINDALIWTTEEVRNLSSIHDFDLPPAFVTNLSELNLRVRNETVPWEEDALYDVFAPGTPDPEKDWWSRWWVAEGKSYLPMQDSDSILSDEQRYVKGKKRIDHWATNSPITFKAQVYGSKLPRPSLEVPARPDTFENIQSVVRKAARWGEVATPTPDMNLEYSQYEIANLERSVIPNNDSLVHVQFHGDLAHYYNSDGSLRDFGSDAETQYNIWATVTPRDESIRVWSVEWITPDGLRIPTKQTEAHTMSSNNGMCRFIWVSDPDQRKMVHYKVERSYNVDKVAVERNTFKLRIRFIGDQFIDVECPITFITADGNGANGTEWEATIWPTNNTDTLDGTQVEGRTPWTWDIQNHPRPLVINGTFDPSGTHVQNNDYKLFLRPFIKRRNVPIESLTEASRYSYKVYWDTRFPVVKADSPRGRASGGSFLKFAQVTNRLATDYGRDGNAAGLAFKAGATVPANQPYQAYTHSRDQQGNAWSGDGTPSPWTPPHNQQQYPRTYGALEVQWDGRNRIPSTKTPQPTFADLDYSFVVKAQIDIFYDNKKVQTIFSYYGVDVLFSNGINFVVQNPTAAQREFKPSLIKTTWPKDVKYSPTGIAPVSRSEFLQFYYGPNATAPLDGPPPHPISAYPINLTKNIQDLTLNIDGLNPRGAYSSSNTYTRTTSLADVVSFEGQFYKVRHTGASLINIPPDRSSNNDDNWARVTDTNRQALLPRPFYFFEQFDNGALATDLVFNTGKWPPGNTHNPDFVNWYANTASPTQANTAKYVRTIVYRLSQFANDDINGWDGKSIDLNEENGTIFAPTIGAGWKHPFTNTFTGVIMGIDKSQLRNAYADNYGGFSGEAVSQMEYMVGLYGYQDGVNSFGILENGTAFFGRADRGGRIIIDGFNAQIYGGITVEKKTGLEADMRNRMRLSFIDFGGAALDTKLLNTPEKVTEFLNRGAASPPTTLTPGATPDPTLGLDVDGMPGIQMGSFEVETQQNFVLSPTAKQWYGNFRNYFAPGIGMIGNTGDPGEDPLAFYFGGFATGSGFSTPAIEIGSYEDWVRTSDGKRITETREDFKVILDGNAGRKHPWRAGKQLIRQLSVSQVGTLGRSDFTKLLEIPGFRRFLVTYDGTLYAMNAFIMGTIMGSNIIGSRFFTDTGDGVMTNYILGFGREGRKAMTVMSTKGTWSATPPTITTQPPSTVFSHLPYTHREFREGGTGDPSQLGDGFNFAVGTDGTVVADKLHITGGSISIGTFHIIGESPWYSEFKKGDVFSYGTLHLMGPGVTPETGAISGSGGTAVSAWGDFYLRGKLTNLGEVYLGATYEKFASTGGYTARSLNSPISVKPTQPSDVYYEDYPNYPVEIGVWPFYFRIGNLGKQPNDDSNNTWVTMSSAKTAGGLDNGYMPSFSLRPATAAKDGFMTPEEGGTATFAESVTWRLDQLGMWSDGIIFSARDGTFGVPMNDTTPLSTKDHGLAYLGWWKQETYAKNQLRLKNINAKAPSLAIETLAHIRISSGKDQKKLRGGTLTADSYHTLLLDVWDPGSTGIVRANRGAALALVAKNGPATDGAASGAFMNGSVIGIEAFEEKSTKETSLDPEVFDSGLRAFLHLGGIGSTQTIIQDESGRDIGRLPKYDANNPGRVWMKAMGIAIEGAGTIKDVATTKATSTIRLNRSWDGNKTSGNMPKEDDYGSTASREGSNFIGIGAGTIMIASFNKPDDGATDTIHIKTANGNGDGNGGNEIFLAGVDHGLLRINAHKEFSFSVAGTLLHERPKRDGFWMDNTVAHLFHNADIHIRTGAEDKDAAEDINEIFLSQSKGELRLSAVTEFSFGIKSPSHTRPTKNGFYMTATEAKFVTESSTGVIVDTTTSKLAWSASQHLALSATELRITGYTADQQYGIYARFG